MNGPLPAELKFRENTANWIMVIFVLYATQTQFKQDQSDTSFIDLCNHLHGTVEICLQKLAHSAVQKFVWTRVNGVSRVTMHYSAHI